jgi:hypothetical protein
MTVVLSGLTAPTILGEVQARGKEQEVKTTLVTQMSESAAEYIAFQSVKVLSRSQYSDAELMKMNDDEYQKWVKRNETIRAQLNAYIIDEQIEHPSDFLRFKWNQYGQWMESFSTFNDTKDEEQRGEDLSKFKGYFDLVLVKPYDEPNWQRLKRIDSRLNEQEWIKLRRLFIQRNAELVEMVMASCTHLRTIPLWWENCKYFPLPPTRPTLPASPTPP